MGPDGPGKRAAISISPAIDDAIAFARVEGIGVRQVSSGWSKAREVVHMTAPLTDDLRARLGADARLRGWTVEATPDDAAEDGFTDDDRQAAICFPRR